MKLAEFYERYAALKKERKHLQLPGTIHSLFSIASRLRALDYQQKKIQIEREKLLKIARGNV